MFKASFPTAKPSSEKAEATWIRENFDLFPHPSADFQSYEEMRLAGLWVPCALAEWLAPSYNLGCEQSIARTRRDNLICLLGVVTALMDALPDPEYLKSGEDSAPASLPTPQSKRRKTETTTNGTNGHLTTPSKNSGSSPQKPSSTSSAQKPPSSSKSRTSPAPSRLTPSRAARGRKAASPSPSAPAVEATTTSSRRSARHSTLPKAVEEEEEEEESVPASSAPNFAEEIAESQSLVQKLKAEQEKATEHVVNASKRTREEAEAPLGLTITEHDDTTVPKEERALIHPNRVARSWVPSLAPNQKAAAWGTLAFAIGWGATYVQFLLGDDLVVDLPSMFRTFLPQVLPQFF